MRLHLLDLLLKRFDALNDRIREVAMIQVYTGNASPVAPNHSPGHTDDRTMGRHRLQRHRVGSDIYIVSKTDIAQHFSADIFSNNSFDVSPIPLSPIWLSKAHSALNS